MKWLQFMRLIQFNENEKVDEVSWENKWKQKLEVKNQRNIHVSRYWVEALNERCLHGAS